jgi:hypothetical protein
MEGMDMISKGTSCKIFLGLACILLCASASAQTLPNLSGDWTGTRTEENSCETPPNSNQVLTLYQLDSDGTVVGTLSTYWPGTAY